MVLKIVRYLAQQGYNSEQLVVLTPYLGQLRTLRDILKKDNDPILNDLDTYELVQAGLLSVAAASVTKKPLRLATIGLDLLLNIVVNYVSNSISYRQLPGRRERHCYYIVDKK